MLSQHDDLSPIEMLVLSFIGSGLKTIYDLLSVARISVGITRPVVRRLRQRGAIDVADDSGGLGRHRSHPYQITERGRELLRLALGEFQSDESWLETHLSGGFDSIPRCHFAKWLWGDHQNWRGYLKKSIEGRMVSMERRRREILRNIQEELLTMPTDATIKDHPVAARVHALTQVMFEAELLKAQLGLVDQFIERLDRLPPASLSPTQFLDELRQNFMTKPSLGQAGV